VVLVVPFLIVQKQTGFGVIWGPCSEAVDCSGRG